MSEPDDFAKLLAAAQDLARKMVSEHGISPPFAVVALRDGTTRTIGVESRTEGSPRLGDLYNGLVASLRSPERRRDFRAVALCATGYASNPATGEQARAILITLEDDSDRAKTVAIPFSRGLLDSVVFHDPMEQPGRPLIFSLRGSVE
jgi:hypothetical protein